MSIQTKYPKSKRPRVFARECGPSLTKQASKNECDVNVIMSRYMKTGVIDHLNEYHGEYGDFGDAQDFLNSQIIVQDAQNMFDSIPAEIRKNFDNSPSKFLDFVQNPENQNDMVEMGLLNRPLPQPSESSPQPPEGSGSPKDQATGSPPPQPPE